MRYVLTVSMDTNKAKRPSLIRIKNKIHEFGGLAHLMPEAAYRAAREISKLDWVERVTITRVQEDHEAIFRRGNKS